MPPIREADERLLAMGAAALANERLRDIGKLGEITFGDHPFAPTFFLGVKRGPKRAHESGDLRPDHRMAEFAFEGSKNCVIEEGPTLADDRFPKFLRRMETDDFIDRVLDDAHRKPGRDIADGRPIFLGLFDRRVHENGAAAPEIDRMGSVEAKPNEIWNRIA